LKENLINNNNNNSTNNDNSSDQINEGQNWN
jgi:hypothetical protein